MKRTVTFGEIMLRLKTPEHMRILQTDAFEASYGGAEANVAVSLAVLKDPVSFVTKLPENPVGTAALNEVRRYGADTYFLFFRCDTGSQREYSKGSIRSLKILQSPRDRDSLRLKLPL